MLDHVTLPVSQLDLSARWYAAALAPLGMTLLERNADCAKFGIGRMPYVTLRDTSAAPTPVHLAFAAESRQQVDAFYAAAVDAGGRDNGPPGLRPQYHPNYYGAFALDPDGHNIEVVRHAPE